MTEQDEITAEDEQAGIEFADDILKWVMDEAERRLLEPAFTSASMGIAYQRLLVALFRAAEATQGIDRGDLALTHISALTESFRILLYEDEDIAR